MYFFPTYVDIVCFSVFFTRFNKPKMDFEGQKVLWLWTEVREVLKDSNEQNLNVSSVRCAFI